MADHPIDYLQELLRRQHQLAQDFPDIIATDPMHTTPQLYSLNLMQLLISSIIMKAVSDKAGISDAEWLTRLDTALNGVWPDWVVEQKAEKMDKAKKDDPAG